MKPRNAQTGAVLFVSLIVLLALSVITVTAARTSGVELLVANSTQGTTSAFFRAEASITAAETYIDTEHGEGGPTFDFSLSGEDGLYMIGGVEPDTRDWSGFEYESVLDGGGGETGRYVVEYVGTIPAPGASVAFGAPASALRHVYRITATGLAERDATRLVSTIYVTP